jgi:mannose-6-phosphate isomerase
LDREELRSHLARVLALWSEHGVDREAGGFFNRLTPDLRPAADLDKRLLVQTRQIWVFSRASAEDSAWLDTAREGYAFLAHYRDLDRGGWYKTTTRDGQPLDTTKDTYAHAFVILALVAYHRASGEAEPLALARETLDTVLSRLADPKRGGYLERASADWQLDTGPRRQNPHMHLLEALLALHEASGDARALGLAEELVELLRRFWLDPDGGFLREHFAPDWSPAPGEPGRRLEPGHHFEWTWLLHEYARVSGGSLPAEAERLFAFARRHGVDDQHGGVYDAVSPDGAVLDSGKRLWPQTEYLRALSVCEPRDLESALERTMDRYVDPATQAWREQADRQGRITSTHLNATSVYHVVGALDLAARRVRQ